MTIPTSIPSSLPLAPGADAAGLDALAAACPGFTGTPAGSAPPAAQPADAAGDPAPDFARLMLPPVTPAAVPPTAAPAAPGSSTRLKLAATAPDGAATPTREQAETAAAMLAPAALVATPPPAAADLAVSTSSLNPVAHPVDPAARVSPGTVTPTTLPPGLTRSAPPAAIPAPDAGLAADPAKIPAPASADNAGREFCPPGHPATLPAPVMTEPATTTASVLPPADLRPAPGAMGAKVAKNAALPVPPAIPASDGSHASIKKILSVEAADDGVPHGKVGIAVAQSDPAMATPLSERPLAADLVVQSFVPGSRADASAPLADIREHRPAVIAQRAVEAVVQVAETQAAARLQPAPGVQLHLKLGGEDIAIRVELREGSVHTQFRTDSHEVRQAIAHEWTVLQAESTGRTLRYLEPEFTGDRPAFSPGSDGRQGAASHQQPRAPQPDIFGAVGRSYPYPRTEADSPVREIAARLLPTSVHLSALA